MLTVRPVLYVLKYAYRFDVLTLLRHPRFLDFIPPLEHDRSDPFKVVKETLHVSTTALISTEVIFIQTRSASSTFHSRRELVLAHVIRLAIRISRTQGRPCRTVLRQLRG